MVATLGPNKRSGVVGLRCLSLPETLLCLVGPAATGWPRVTAALGACPERHSVGHCASSLAVWRNWEGGISSSPFQELIANCVVTFGQVKNSQVIVQRRSVLASEQENKGMKKQRYGSDFRGIK